MPYINDALIALITILLLKKKKKAVTADVPEQTK